MAFAVGFIDLMKHRRRILEELRWTTDLALVLLFFGPPFIVGLSGGSEGHVGTGGLKIGWVGIVIWIITIVLLMIASVVLHRSCGKSQTANLAEATPRPRSCARVVCWFLVAIVLVRMCLGLFFEFIDAVTQI